MAKTPTPSLLLRIDQIRPGDILLIRGLGKMSTVIADLSASEFSHAALCINHVFTFESDGGIIGLRRFFSYGSEYKNGKLISYVRIGGNPAECVVLRHPRFEQFAEYFDKAVEAEMKESWGKDYSEHARLIRKADISEAFKPILAAILLRFEQAFCDTRTRGPFCSELVARVYKRLGLDLFPDGRGPDDVSPEDLAHSELRIVPDIVVRPGELGDLHRSFRKDAFEDLYPEGDDRLAHERREQRRIEHGLESLDRTLERWLDQTRANLAVLTAGFRSSLKEMVALVVDAERFELNFGKHFPFRVPECLTQRCTRLLMRSVDVYTRLASIGEHGLSNPNLIQKIDLEISRANKSLLRNRALLAARHAKLGMTLASGFWGAVRRFRLHRVRRSCARLVAQKLREIEMMRGFLARLFKSGGENIAPA